MFNSKASAKLSMARANLSETTNNDRMYLALLKIKHETPQYFVLYSEEWESLLALGYLQEAVYTDWIQHTRKIMSGWCEAKNVNNKQYEQDNSKPKQQ